jgi:flavin-dependent dehydrogenase
VGPVSGPASTEQHDVIVVGAGPAGCAAAIAVAQAAPRLRVLVLDRADFPRDKPCGDGIAHEVEAELAALGFDVPRIFEGTVPVTRLALRSPNGVLVHRRMAQPVHVVPRRLFDARLVRQVTERGIEVRRHPVRQLRPDAGGVALDATLRARVVIGADGAESVVRRSLAPSRRWPARGRPAPVALAIRGYAAEPAGFAEPAGSAGSAGLAGPAGSAGSVGSTGLAGLAGLAGSQFITMTERHWPAYAWSFPIGDGRANVGYGELLGARQLSRADLLDRLHALLPGLGGIDGLRAHRLPLSSGRPVIPDGPVLLAGDAQSMINPFTGEGIFYAVVSGALAGRAAAQAVTDGGNAGSRYRRATRRRLGRHLAHTTAVARLGGRPALIDAGLRAARDDQRAFDDLVRFGLADGLLTRRLLARLRFTG